LRVGSTWQAKRVASRQQSTAVGVQA